ncbi:MAG: DUF2071 domain-containing protein [Bryobacteraceae bacterium]
MLQAWHDLLFLHWPVDASKLRNLIPSSLELDTFGGQAYLAVVPFRMSEIHPVGLPTVPGLSAFPELNVRTYVVRDGRPGVWFFSLDAANLIAVHVARRWFSLPYFHARMSCRADGGGIQYRSSRIHADAPAADFLAMYAPTGEAFEAEPGTLEYFLTARYCLYSESAGQLHRAEIDHAPWRLHTAEADIELDTMADWLGFPSRGPAPLRHFSRTIDVEVWPLEPVSQ